MLYPSQFKTVLKQLLTIYPDKMMFGSDAFPFNDALGAEESFLACGPDDASVFVGSRLGGTCPPKP